MSKIRFIKSKKILVPLLGLLIVAGVVAALEIANVTHFFHKEPSKEVVTVGKPVPSPKFASSSPNSSPPTKTPTSNSSVTASSRNAGGATDTKGSATTSTSPSQWTVSKSGYITVKQPVANAKLQDGSTVSGSAKVGTVHYRLIDNTVGVIAQGTLSVVNGTFSGTLHFQPHGTGGRLDVFSTDADGVEYNEVQINVSF